MPPPPQKAPSGQQTAPAAPVQEPLTQGGYKVTGKLGSQTLVLQIDPPPRGWLDASIYAPTIPGILVALLGLWVSHYLAQKRDRRKELLDLCSSVKDLAEEATKSAIEGWASDASPERRLAILETKSKLQALGVAATTLKRRSTVRFIVIRRLFDKKSSIDVLKQVADLRRAATRDPFEDPTRAGVDSSFGNISSKRSALLTELDDSFSQLFG